MVTTIVITIITIIDIEAIAVAKAVTIIEFVISFFAFIIINIGCCWGKLEAITNIVVIIIKLTKESFDFLIIKSKVIVTITIKDTIRNFNQAIVGQICVIRESLRAYYGMQTISLFLFESCLVFLYGFKYYFSLKYYFSFFLNIIIYC